MMYSTFNPYDLFHYLKKEGSSYEEAAQAVQTRNEEIPAYEYLIRKYLSSEHCHAVVVRSDGIEEPRYTITGYDPDHRTVFVQARTGAYGSSKNQEMKSLEIEEFIFGPYRIWDTVDPVAQYEYYSFEKAKECANTELPF